MSSLTLIVMCTALAAGNESNDYAAAHKVTMKTGRPMLVMVSTDWCAPCQMMKRTVIPQVRQRGLLGRVVFAIVNPDRDRELARQLIGGGPVPQLVLFRKTANGWTQKKLVGGQSVEAVEQFIKEGEVSDAAPPKTPAKTPAGPAKEAPAAGGQKRPNV